MSETPSNPQEIDLSPHTDAAEGDSGANLELISREDQSLESQPHSVTEAKMLPELKDGSRSSWNFIKTMEANVRMEGRIGEVVGLEHYVDWVNSQEQENKQGNPVIATTHHTNVDVQAVAVVFGRIANVGVASLQTNQEDPVTGKLQRVAGKDNFYDIANTYSEGKMGFKLNPENFKAMAQAIQSQNKTMMIASYSPHYEGYGDRALPDKPGLAAVVTANLSSRVIMPTAAVWPPSETGNIEMANNKLGIFNNILNPSVVKIHVGEAIGLDDLPEEIITSKEDVEQAIRLFSSDTRQQMDRQTQSRALQTIRKLEQQAEIVMMAQAAMMPAESRGVWGERLEKQQEWLAGKQAGASEIIDSQDSTEAYKETRIAPAAS